MFGGSANVAYVRTLRQGQFTRQLLRFRRDPKMTGNGNKRMEAYIRLAADGISSGRAVSNAI
ncbi:hypothetical protein GCM10011491_43170 [Brucella endophytica]|uniref:Uncharacterized protein n=1 Tax=Brucella endophytica TaxID=1963359 RepID=A0A916SQH8_9HYPH|nr:hypothetical protein GCM10011491_43170 [Brucella endophytica]